MSFSYYYQIRNSGSYESLVSQYVPILTNQIKIINESKHKQKIKIAIIGAGIGGCATAYFLEDLFNAMNDKQITIDLYEKEDELGKSGSKFKYNDLSYDINPVKIDESQYYMSFFVKNSGCKMSNDIDEKMLTGLFDSNGIKVQKYGQFNKIDNIKILISKFGLKSALQFFKFLIDCIKFKSRVYLLQDDGYTFDSVEKLVRRINPNIFTLSQKTFYEQVKKFSNKYMDNLSNLACMEGVAQTNRVPGLVGCNSIVNFFNSSFIKDDTKKILKYLLSNCLRTRLYLKHHVKSVAYDTKNSHEKNLIIYTKNSRDYRKSYDYVIVAFPLTKNIYGENFSLDILYRDFLDCELVRLNSYLIEGVFSMLSPRTNRQFKLYTLDPDLKFCSIKTCSPLEEDNERILFCVSSTKDINEITFDSVFEKGWKCVKKVTNFVAPLYKKVRYSHTPFPQVIIDESDRSRVFYLNGLQWLSCSKESNCISARNIAFLIGKKEFGKKLFQKKLDGVQKYFKDEANYCKKLNIMLLTFFTSIFTIIVYKKFNQ